MKQAPTRGYILTLWENPNAYRATAQAYMKREKINEVKNVNGNTYTLEDVQNSMIK